MDSPVHTDAATIMASKTYRIINGERILVALHVELLNDLGHTLEQAPLPIAGGAVKRMGVTLERWGFALGVEVAGTPVTANGDLRTIGRRWVAVPLEPYVCTWHDLESTAFVKVTGATRDEAHARMRDSLERRITGLVAAALQDKARVELDNALAAGGGTTRVLRGQVLTVALRIAAPAN